MPLTLEIVTPEAKVYSDTIDSVVIPTVEGEIGVLPGHIPLLTQVEDGELRVTKGAATQLLVVSGGFAQIDGDRVRILAENAINEEKIDEHAVEAALKRAEEQLREAKDMDPQQYEQLQSMVRYSGVQLAVKRKKR
ncbi:ATP synthase epsilon chain [Lacunisphaera limnophila]|jgi:F-type H+-transporting ATPase subunit epsilon|uniref:ATP synthase epsilon chain n=1 Tax=Lacunisphaera limnophila TaxID=1838286 RepID=A0A1D8ASV9_9BACT|nr:ATP synthase F1 subunit epsilon [Lacunisphaera limnophila]AOS43988.1 ATP synthase epsilon chain [Lacunisphaera limnophila]